jgi:phosphatidylinositol glycan class B
MGTKMRLNKCLLLFIAWRVFGCLLAKSYLYPDEYWQSLEVAHKSVFGVGYLTWEWNRGLRSYLFPGIFIAFYAVLDFVGLSRNYFLMVSLNC